VRTRIVAARDERRLGFGNFRESLDGGGRPIDRSRVSLWSNDNEVVCISECVQSHSSIHDASATGWTEAPALPLAHLQGFTAPTATTST
jgi:hypothetical protein